MAGAAGMWFVEHSSEDDEDEGDCDHQRREVRLFSIGSFLAGSILYHWSESE